MSYIYTPCRPCCDEPGGFPPPVKDPNVSLYKMWPSTGSNLTRIIWAKAASLSGGLQGRSLWPNTWTIVGEYKDNFGVPGETRLTFLEDGKQAPYGRAENGIIIHRNSQVPKTWITKSVSGLVTTITKVYGTTDFVHPTLGIVSGLRYGPSLASNTLPAGASLPADPDYFKFDSSIGVNLAWSIGASLANPSYINVTRINAQTLTYLDKIQYSMTNSERLIMANLFQVSKTHGVDDHIVFVSRQLLVGGGYALVFLKFSTTTGAIIQHTILPNDKYGAPAAFDLNRVHRIVGINDSKVFVLYAEYNTTYGWHYPCFLDTLDYGNGTVLDRVTLPITSSERLVEAYYDTNDNSLYAAVKLYSPGTLETCSLRKYSMDGVELWRYNFTALVGVSTYFQNQSRVKLKVDFDGHIFLHTQYDYPLNEV